MKIKQFYTIAIISSLILFACNKKEPIGKWNDIIKLSGKDFTFKSGGDSVLITAQGKWWGIDCIALDSVRLNIFNPTGDVCNFIYTDNNLAITSRDCNTLFIKMNPNLKGSERVLNISLMAGDYRDGIKITQAK
ncbi:MAG: hypothetical protein JST23_13500 [Bacteroidetes bacterium]|nr:hypothetical protein [Bacteroidota bacterium]